MNLGGIRDDVAERLGALDVVAERVEVVDSTPARTGWLVQLAEFGSDRAVTTIRAHLRFAQCPHGAAPERGTVCTVRGSLVPSPEELSFRIDARWVEWHAGETGPLALARDRVLADIDCGRIRPQPERDINEVIAAARRVLVLSPPRAAGLEDFRQAVKRVSGVEFVYESVVMGGASGANDLTQALARTDRDVDAMVLVRGGGSRFDLRAFDDERVVKAIAEASVPVMLGIGHARDSDLLAGKVATVSWATPTQAGRQLAAAEYQRRKVIKDAEIARKRKLAEARSQREREERKRLADQALASLKADRDRWNLEAQQVALLWRDARLAVMREARTRVRQRASVIAIGVWSTSILAVAALASFGQLTIAAACLTTGAVGGTFFWLGRTRADRPLKAKRHRAVQDERWIRYALGARNPRTYRHMLQPRPLAPRARR